MNANAETPENHVAIVSKEAVGEMFEVMAVEEQRLAGSFDALLNRSAAITLAKAGFFIIPDTSSTRDMEQEIFGIIIETEDKLRGVFDAAMGRAKAKALTAAGCVK